NRRLVVDRPDHAGRPREAPCRGLRPSGAARGGRADARPAPERRLPLSLLRLDRDQAGEPVRPDAVPLAPLVRELPPAVRAVQDALDGLRPNPRRLLRAFGAPLHAGLTSCVLQLRNLALPMRRVAFVLLVLI